MPRPRVGDASEETPIEEPEREPEGGSPRAGALGDPLCPGCTHLHVCTVAAAIRTVGGEGQIEVSKCPAFEALPPGVVLEPTS